MLKGAPEPAASACAAACGNKRRSFGALNSRARKSKGCVRPVFIQPARAMIRFLLRFVGLLLLATAFIFLVYDGTKSIANQQLLYVKVSDVWAMIDQNTLKQLQPVIEKHAPHWLWDPVTIAVLNAPTWLVLGILAAILILLGRKKRPLIGYGRD
jgi:hypothetical protein